MSKNKNSADSPHPNTIPVLINNLEELRSLSIEMKTVAGPDSKLADYTQTDEEVENLFDTAKKVAETDPEPIVSLRSNRVIQYRGNIYSLCLTRDENNGHDFHLSAVHIVPWISPPMRAITDEVMNFIGSGFFSSFEHIPNPGKVEQIRHLVGNW